MNPGQTYPEDGRQADAVNNENQLLSRGGIGSNLDNTAFGLLRV